MKPGVLCIVLALTCSLSGTQTRAGDLEKTITEIRAKLSAGFSPSGQTQFDNAQQAWEAFRDRECRYRQLSFPLLTSQSECRQSLDTERLHALRMQLNWQQGIAGSTDSVSGSCSMTAGSRTAERLKRRCLSVSDDRRSDCDPINTCGRIERAIRRGCALIGNGAPAFCGQNR